MDDEAARTQPAPVPVTLDRPAADRDDARASARDFFDHLGLVDAERGLAFTRKDRSDRSVTAHDLLVRVDKPQGQQPRQLPPGDGLAGAHKTGEGYVHSPRYSSSRTKNLLWFGNRNRSLPAVEDRHDAIVACRQLTRVQRVKVERCLVDLRLAGLQHERGRP